MDHWRPTLERRHRQETGRESVLEDRPDARRPKHAHIFILFYY